MNARTFALTFALAALTFAGVAAPPCLAMPVPLDPAKTESTFNQGGFSPADAVDDNPATRGWAISGSGDESGDGTGTEEATFGTVSPLELSASGFGVTNTVDFTMTFDFQDSAAGHTLGLFKISVTDDPSPGLASSWTDLVPISATSVTANDTFTFRPDNFILVTGPNEDNDTYTVDFATFGGLDEITGFRLFVLDDDTTTLPTGGPGRPSNGNFVITDFDVEATLNAVPEPSTGLFVFLGGLWAASRRKRR